MGGPRRWAVSRILLALLSACVLLSTALGGAVREPSRNTTEGSQAPALDSRAVSANFQQGTVLKGLGLAPFIFDLTSSVAISSLPFAFSAYVLDADGTIQEVHVEYWVAGGAHNNATMNQFPLSNIYNLIQSGVTVSNISYFISARDDQGKWNSTSIKVIDVINFTAPLYIFDSTPPLAAAGDSLTFLALVVPTAYEAHVVHWYDGQSPINETLTCVLVLCSRTLAFIPEGKLHYFFSARDLVGNWARTNERIVEVAPLPTARIIGSLQGESQEIFVLNGLRSTGRLVAYAWEYGDSSSTIPGPPIVTHIYRTPGTYALNLTVLDIFGRIAANSTSVLVQSPSGVRVLVIDPRMDYAAILLRELYPAESWFFSNTTQTAFWKALDSDPGIDIIVRPPTYNDLVFPFKPSSIQDYLKELNPQVIILSDVFLDGGGRWGLNMTQREALLQYLSAGRGLIVTGGSLFDLRFKTSKDVGTDIGPYGHTYRLFLESKDVNKTRRSYNSSLAAEVGLGLLPVYEELREQIGRFVEAGAPLLAPIVYSAPLLPTGVPFDAAFQAPNGSDPLLSGVGPSFLVDFTNPACGAPRGVRTFLCPHGTLNQTLVGWQLNYPRLAAQWAIAQAEQRLPVVRDSIMMALNQSGLLSTLPTFFPNVTGSYRDTDLREAVENSTRLMLDFLSNLDAARLATPQSIDVNVSVTVGGLTFRTNRSIPVPVELQKLLRPGILVARSEDYLAGISRYEIAGHRSVFFSFDPALGNATAVRLVKNAILWASQPASQIPVLKIGNVALPRNLTQAARGAVPPGYILSAQEIHLGHTGKALTANWTFDASSRVAVYWPDAPGAQVSLVRQDGSAGAVERFQIQGWNAALLSAPSAGRWNLSLLLNDGGLLVPVVVEVFHTTDTTPPYVAIKSPQGGSFLASASVSVRWVAADNLSGIDHVEVSLDGGPFAQVGTATNYTFSGLGEGAHAVSVRAVDKSGNSAQAGISFTVDITPPNLAITSPPPGTLSANATVRVAWTASDSTSGIDHLEVNLDGASVATLPATASNYTLANVANGSHTITVTAFDRAGNSRAASVNITVQIKPAVPLLQVVIGANPSSGTAPLTASLTSATSGGLPPYTYSWTFGDGGTSTDANPGHTYGKPGTFAATLTVTDSLGTHRTALTIITITAAPLQLTVTANPDSGIAPLGVDFKGTVSGGLGPYGYDWSFGDGASSADANPHHEYARAGSYEARLVVTDSEGAQVSQKAIVSVAAPLEVTITTDRTSGTVPLTVQFTAVVTGGSGTYGYEWTFGDGTMSSDLNPKHTFQSSGSYTVTLAVRDQGGQSVTRAVQITASSPSALPVLPVAGVGAAVATVATALVLLYRRRKA